VAFSDLFVSENIELKNHVIMSDKHKENNNLIKVVWLNIYCFMFIHFFLNVHPEI
jgi:hypothetical protein